MSNTPTAQQIHPIQRLINRLAPIMGFLTAAFLLILCISSIALVIDASSHISESAKLLTLIGAVALLLIQRYFINFIKKDTLLIRGQKLDYLTLWITPLLVCGFVQTFFWVIDSENPIHEPRSVFILLSAGILVFFRNQIRITEANQAVQQTSHEEQVRGD